LGAGKDEHHKMSKDAKMASQGIKKRRSNHGNKLEVFVQNCRRNGLKITPQRMAVYKTLLESKEHPSAEMVLGYVRRLFPGISLDTVNRTLLTLAEIGSASIMEGSGDARRYDGDIDTHQHFKCIKCKKVFDFHYEPFDDIKIPASINAKFKILRKTVYLEGICDSCTGKSRHNPLTKKKVDHK
jgi:Fur family peroxide stress response transcriptional regulator